MATEFNTQVSSREYRLQFETNNEAHYLLMQSAARRCIDRAHMANADRIRSMSDEELEEGIGRLSLGYQPWCDHHCKVNGDYNCNRCLRIWLQRPAKESE